jgi:hypothetical protein
MEDSVLLFIPRRHKSPEQNWPRCRGSLMGLKPGLSVLTIMIAGKQQEINAVTDCLTD